MKKSSRTPSRRWERRLLSLAVASCFVTEAAIAAGPVLPAGPTVINGQVYFNYNGNLLKITNTPGSIINWQSFSIGANDVTRFIQQSASSTVLNRVAAGNPSVILGALQSQLANGAIGGRVFLINPSGVVFGAGAQINTGGLVVSSLGLSDADFLAGRNRFTEVPGAGAIVNQGKITTPNGGSIYLIAPNVTNSGIIKSDGGQIVLAAGKSVEIVATDSPDIRVTITAPDNEAVNLGQIIAQGGKVGIYGGLVRQGGVVNANTAVRGENGKIVFKATKDVTLEPGSTTTASGPTAGSISIQADTGKATIAGTVEANATQGKGGTVSVSGQQGVSIEPTGSITASGIDGGSVALTSSAGAVTIAGAVSADAISGRAGDVAVVAATNASLASTAQVSASGGVGGGTVAIKGTKSVALAAGSSVVATGATGGSIAVQSEQGTVVAQGTVDATGSDGPGGDIQVAALSDVTLDDSSRLLVGGTIGGVAKVRSSEGTLIASGVIDGQGNEGPGGQVWLLAPRVGLIRQSVVNVSGRAGGGTVLVGGDYHGDNPAVQNAWRTYVGSDVAINADATESGNGGKVVVWADDLTRFYGTISARGGVRSGDGGFSEVSGKNILDFNGTVDLTAPHGVVGMLLLDPRDLDISTGSQNNITGAGTEASPFVSSGAGSVLNVTTLETQLGLSAVRIQTGAGGGNGDITVLNTVTAPANGNNLTLEAHRHIDLQANIDFTASSGTLVLKADGVSPDGVGAILQNGGTLQMGAASQLQMSAGSGIGTSGSPILTTGLTNVAATTGTGGIYIQNGTSGNVNVTQITTATGGTTSGLTTTAAGAGDIKLVNSAGSITVSQPISTVADTSTGNITLQTTPGTGNIVVNSTVTTGVATDTDGGPAQTPTSGNITVNSGGNITGSGQLLTGSATLNGNAAGGSDSANSGNISLTAAAGTIGLSDSNALQIGTAQRTGGGAGTDSATVGNIVFNSSGEINNGTASTSLGFTIGAASGALTNNQGNLQATTTGGAAGKIFATSASSFNSGAITTSGGDVSIATTGAGALLTATAGIDTTNGGGTPGGASITLTADDIDLSALAANSIKAGTGANTVILKPNAANRTINITSGSTGQLDLSPTELQTVSAAGGTLQLGATGATGDINLNANLVSANINAGTLKLLSGHDVNITGGNNIGATGGGNEFNHHLELRASNDVTITNGSVFLADNKNLTVVADNDVSGAGTATLGGNGNIVQIGTGGGNTTGAMSVQGRNISLGGSGGSIVVTGGGAQTFTATGQIDVNSTTNGFVLVSTAAGLQTFDTSAATGSGNLVIQSSGTGGALGNATVQSTAGAQNINLKGGLSVLSSAGGSASATAALSASSGQTIAAKFVEVIGQGAALATINNDTTSGNASIQSITANGVNGSGESIIVNALGTAGATIQNGIAASTGQQNITVNGSGANLLRVKGTASDARILANGTGVAANQQNITVSGGTSNAIEIGDVAAGATAAISGIVGRNQTVIADTLSIRGGTGITKHSQLVNSLGTQTVTLAGTLTLVGGTAVGTVSGCGVATGGSCAFVSNNGAGLQQITANKIDMKGGDIGGSTGAYDSAGIFVNAGNMQLGVGAGGLVMLGGDGSATGNNGSTIGGSGASGRTLTLAVAGDTTLTGGTTDSSSAFIGIGGVGSGNSITVTFTGTTGDVILNGSTGLNAGAAIGSGRQQDNATATVTITGKNITLNPGTVGVARIGHSTADLTPGGGDISVAATGGDIKLLNGGGAAGYIRTTGNVMLQASSAGKLISEQSGAHVDANTLTAFADSGVALDGNNAVASIAISNSSAGAVTFKNSTALDISAIGIDNVGRNVTIDNVGSVTESGVITAGGLELLEHGAGATYTLTQNNAVGKLAANVSTGALQFTNAGAFSVDTVNTVGITSGNKDVTLSAGGTLTLLKDITAGTGKINLTTTAGDITSNGGKAKTTENTTGLTLNAAGGIGIGGGGALLTDLGGVGMLNLTTNGAGAAGNSTITEASTFNASQVNNVTLNGTGHTLTFTAPTVNLTSGSINKADNDFTFVSTASDINVNLAVAIGTGTLRLNSFGKVNQTGGSIAAAGLGVIAADDVDLTSGSNHVSTFAANNSGSTKHVNYTDTGGFTIGTVSAATGFGTTSGISTVNGNVSVTAGNAMSLSGAIPISAGTGTVSLTTTAGDIDFAGATLTAGAATINAAGSVLSSGAAGTDIDTSANNGTITVIAGNSIGAVGNPLEVKPGTGSMNFTATAGDMYVDQSAGNLLFSKLAFVSQGGAAKTRLFSTTNGSINVDSYAGFQANTTDEIVFINANGGASTLTFNTASPAQTANVTGTAGQNIVLNVANSVTTTGNVTLTAGGTIGDNGGTGTVSGVLLTTTSVGGTSLTGANAISSLNATNSGSGALTITNPAALTITGISQAGGGAVTVTNTGSVSITGTVSAAGGGAINLSASGAGATLSESGGGLISTTGTLTTSSVAGTTLNGANTVSSFGASNTTSGDISLTNTGALNIAAAGITQNVGNLNLTNTGAITQTGTISNNGAGSVATLAAGAANNINLGGGNDFTEVRITNGNATTLNDSNALKLGASTVSGNYTVTAVGDITTTGPLALNGATNSIAASGAANDLIISTAITRNSGAAGTLGLSAKRDVMFAAGGSVDGTGGAGKLDVTLTSDTDSAGGGVISMAAATFVKSNGGNIVLTGGTGNAVSATDGVAGVTLTNANLTAAAGGVTINGKGFAGTNNNIGVAIAGGSQVTGDGGIGITGTGGAASGTGNFGVSLNGAGTLVATAGAGGITITGNRGSGTSSNEGIVIDAGARVRSTVAGTGAILLTAGGGGAVSGTGNVGISVANGSVVESLKVAGGSSITLNGTGGAGSGVDHGVYISGAGAAVTSASGAVNITGIAQGSGTDNYGVRVESGGIVQSNGAGNITVNGTGSSGGTDTDVGVYLLGAGSKISSTSTGSVSVTGTGGNSSGVQNIGVFVQTGAVIESTGGAGGSITVNGTGGNGSSNNWGVAVSGAGSAVNSANGAITVSGTGGTATGTDNYGVFVDIGGTIASTGAGNIGITATGKPGAGTGHGFVFGGATASSVSSTSTGNISITATGAGAGGIGITNISGGTHAIGGGSGNVTLMSDTLTLDSINVTTTGNVYLLPKTVGTAVSIGGAAAFDLNQTELTNISAAVNRIFIGEDSASTVTAGTVTTAAGGAVNIGARNLTLSGTDISAGANTLTVAGGKNLTLKASTGAVDGNAGAGVDFAAGSINVNAVTGIGSTNQLSTSTGTLAAANTTSNNVSITNNQSLNLGGGSTVSNSAAGGSITVAVTGNDRDLTVGNTISTAGGGAIDLSAARHVIFAQGAGVTGVSTTGTAILTADVNGASNSTRGAIQGNAAVATDVAANILNAAAGAGIGTGSALETVVASIGLVNNVSGPITVVDNSAALAVTSISQTGAGTVGITNNGGGVNFTGAASVAGGTLSVTATGAITQGAVALTGNALQAKTKNAGGAAITLNSATNDFTSVDLRARDATDTANAAGAITYRDANNFDVATIGTTNTVNLASVSGAITDSGAIAATTLTTNTVNGTILDFGHSVTGFNATNTVSGDVQLVNNTGAGNLNVTGISESGGNVVISNSGAGGGVNFSGAVTVAGGNLNVTATGAITQGAIALSGASLFAKTKNAAGAAINLNSGTNSFAAVDLRARDATDTANAPGAITYNNAATFDVATIGTASTVNLTSVAGSITDSGAITGTTLTTNSVTGTALDAGHSVTGFNAMNTASGNVQLVNTAATLTVTGVSQSGGGNVNINNTGNLTTSGAVTTAANGNIDLTATNGVLTVGAGVTSGGAGIATLTTTGVGKDIVFSGATATLTAGTANLTATGAVTSGAAATDIDTSANNGTITVNAGTSIGTAVNALEVKPGSGSMNFSAGSGGIFVDLSAGNLLFSKLTSVSAAGAGQTIRFSTTAGNIQVDNTGGLNGNTANDNFVLTSASTIAESGGAFFNANSLTTTSVGGATLTNANTVGTFNATNSGGGNVQYTNATSLSVSGITQSGGGSVTVAVNGNDKDLTIGNTVSTTAGAAINLSAARHIIFAQGAGVTGVSTTGAATLTADTAGAGNTTRGAIQGNAAVATDVSANSLTAFANTGIGTGSPLETALSNLAFTNSGIGAVSIVNTSAGLTLAASSNTSGAVTVSNSTGMTLSGLLSTGNNGTVALTAAGGGALTINAAGVINADGAVTLTGAGGISTAGNVTTTNDDITYASPTTLTGGGTVVLDTGAGAGNILFSSTLTGTTAGAENLTLNAGTGNVTFTGAAGGTRLGAVTINSAANVTESAGLTAASFVQTAGTGTTTFNGAVNTNTAAGVQLTTNNIAVNNTITTTSNGVVKFTNAGLLTLNSNVGADGAVTQNGGGAVTVTGTRTITTTADDVNFLRAVTLNGGQFNVNTAGTGPGTGDITFQSTLTGTTAGAENLNLMAGTSNVLLNGAVGGTRLGVVSINSASNVTENAGLTAASFAQTAGTGTTTFNGPVNTNTAAGVQLTTNNIAVNNTITTTTNGVVTFTNAGLLTLNSNIGADGAATQNGGGAVTVTGTRTIATTADDVNFLRAVTLNGGQFNVNTAGTGAGTGDITFQSTLTGTTAGAENLNLTAGSSNILFTGAVGGTRLGAVTVNSANNVTESAGLTAASFVQSAGTGTTTFNGAVNTNAAAGVQLTTNNIAVNNIVTTANNGVVTFTNAGAVNIAAAGDMNLDGAFTQNGAGAVTTAGDITTTNDNIGFLRATVLSGNAVLTSGSGNITFSNTLDGAAGLTANSSATMAFTGQVGGITPLAFLTTTNGAGTVQVNGGLVATVGNQTYADKVQLNAATTFNASSPAATIAFNKAGTALDAQANAVIISADEIDFGGGANSVRGSSTIQLQPNNPNAAIWLGTAADVPQGPHANELDLTTADLAALKLGFTAVGPAVPVTVGQNAGTHTITIGTATFSDSVLIQAPVGAGNIQWYTGGGTPILSAPNISFNVPGQISGGGIVNAAPAGTLRVIQSGGIGAVGAPLITHVGVIEAANSGSGDVYIQNDRDVTLQNQFVNNVPGKVLWLETNGTINTGTAVVSIPAGGGQIVLTAHDTVAAPDVTGRGTITVGAGGITSNGGTIALHAADNIIVNGVVDSSFGGGGGNIEIIAGGINAALPGLLSGPLTLPALETTADSIGSISLNALIRAGTGVPSTRGDLVLISATNGSNILSGAISQTANGTILANNLTAVTLRGAGGSGLGGGEIKLNVASNPSLNSTNAINLYACPQDGCPDTTAVPKQPFTNAPMIANLGVLPPTRQYADGPIFYTDVGGTIVSGIGTVNDFTFFTPGLGITPVNGSTLVGRNVTLETPGSFDIDLVSKVTASNIVAGGTLRFVAGTDINYNDATAGMTFGDPAAPGQNGYNLSFNAAGNINLNNSIYVGPVGSLVVNANSNVTFTASSPPNQTVMATGTGDVTMSGNHEIRVGGNLTLNARDLNLLGGELSPASYNQNSIGQQLNVAGALTVNLARDLNITAGPATYVVNANASVSSGSAALINAGTVSISAQKMTLTANDGGSGKSADAKIVSGGDITATIGGDLGMNSGTATGSGTGASAIQAGGNLNLALGGNFTLMAGQNSSSTLTGSNVSVNAMNVTMKSGANVGQSADALIQAVNAVTIATPGDLLLDASTGSASSASVVGSTISIGSAGMRVHDVTLKAGSSNTAGAASVYSDAQIKATGSLSLFASGNLSLTGGSAINTSGSPVVASAVANLEAGSMMLDVGGNVSVKGGPGSIPTPCDGGGVVYGACAMGGIAASTLDIGANASANILSHSALSPMIGGSLSLIGGTASAGAANSHASAAAMIRGEPNLNVSVLSGDLNLSAGTASASGGNAISSASALLSSDTKKDVTVFTGKVSFTGGTSAAAGGGSAAAIAGMDAGNAAGTLETLTNVSVNGTMTMTGGSQTGTSANSSAIILSRGGIKIRSSGLVLNGDGSSGLFQNLLSTGTVIRLDGSVPPVSVTGPVSICPLAVAACAGGATFGTSFILSGAPPSNLDPLSANLLSSLSFLNNLIRTQLGTFLSPDSKKDKNYCS